MKIFHLCTKCGKDGLKVERAKLGENDVYTVHIKCGCGEKDQYRISRVDLLTALMSQEFLTAFGPLKKQIVKQEAMELW